MQSLKEKLVQNSGQTQVYLHVDIPHIEARYQILVGDELYVQPNQSLIQDIETLLGEGRFSLTI